MQAQHTDRQKAVPMFNAFQSKGQDDISRWLAKVSENPIVEAFPEKIDIHPGMDSSMLLPTEMPEVLSELVSKPRTRRTVAYINVPYCETRCLYCLFYIKPYRNKEESNAFADTLIKELQLWSDKPVQKGEPVHAVYFGGGTPTALEACDIERIIAAIFRSPMTAKSLMKGVCPVLEPTKWKPLWPGAPTVSLWGSRVLIRRFVRLSAAAQIRKP